MVQPWPDQPYRFQACYNVPHTYCITTENFSLALMQAILKRTTRLVEQIMWGLLMLTPIIYELECFKSHSKGSNLHSNSSNLVGMVRVEYFESLSNWIRMLWIPFEWFEFTFKCFESLSNGSNLDSNASNPFWMVWICILILQIPFECLEFAFKTFLSRSKG